MFDREILFKLYDNYKAEFHDITEFIFNKFPEECESVYLHIRQTLNFLESENLVYYESKEYNYLGGYTAIKKRVHIENEFVDFKKFIERHDHIRAKIKLQGKKKLNF
jgi:hypothetical protein